MADIAKLGGTGIDDLAKVWGTDVASLAKIMGLDVPSGGGTTITAGTPAVFESAATTHISVAMLTSTKAIVCYRDGGNSNYGTACILTESSGTITAGTPTVFESALAFYISVVALTSTKAIVCYTDNGNSNYGTACILTESSGTITAGTPTVFESASAYHNSVAMLTSTKAIVCYQDGGNSSYGTACILTESDGTITAEDPAVFESAYTEYISAAMLTSTKAIVCYRDDGNSGHGTACILTESDGTITAGDPAVFESADTTYTSVAMLTSTKAIVCYRDGGNSGYGTACILTESSGTITAGTPAVFESADTTYTSVAMLASTKAIVCYRDVGNSNYGTACLLTESSGTITAGTPAVFESASTDYISATMLTSTKAIVCYRDGDNSSYGTANTLVIS
jgi:hypothetical protein